MSSDLQTDATRTVEETEPGRPDGTGGSDGAGGGDGNGRDPGPSKGAPALGLVGGLRFLWTQLTSMRTALVLLFALAVAAIPGSVIPQRKISPIAVDDFISQHRTLGPLYDKVGLFAVYSSPWFSAVYLLLFVSLIGCIVPRVLTYARAVRAKPVRTPRNLGRLPVAESWESADEASVVLDRAEAELRRRRYRVARRTDAGGESISAERGYLREAGNLVFHLSLLFVLLGVAINGLTQFRGSSVVVVGQGFSNSLSQYDDFSAGGLFSERQLVPFSLQLTDFQVRFETGPVQTGAARLFKATLKVTDAPGEPARTETLEVNHPLNIDGTDVHLIGHGYAPVVTVKDAQGNVAFSGPVVFLPQDGNFTSSGVIKVPDARPERLAFQGLFLPTGAMTPAGPQSVFPDLLQPQLLLNAWEGKPQADTGVPESVYTLDTSGLTQVRDPKNPNQPFRFLLRPGYEQKLPNGLGTIQLTGVQRWVKLQVGDSPGVGVALVAIGTGVLGLCFSLFVRPRRVWIRVRPAASVGGPDPNHPEDGDATGAAADPAATREGRRTVVDVGALDRADARTGLAEDVAELATTLGRPATTQKDV